MSWSLPCAKVSAGMIWWPGSPWLSTGAGVDQVVPLVERRQDDARIAEDGVGPLARVTARRPRQIRAAGGVERHRREAHSSGTRSRSCPDRTSPSVATTVGDETVAPPLVERTVTMASGSDAVVELPPGNLQRAGLRDRSRAWRPERAGAASGRAGRRRADERRDRRASTVQSLLMSAFGLKPV